MPKMTRRAKPRDGGKKPKKKTSILFQERVTYGDYKGAASANLTPAVNGIPYYTEELFIETFRTGKVRSRQLNGFMPTRYFRDFTDQDLKDVFAYLKSLKPVDHFVDNAMPPTACARCGLTHGGG